MNYQNYDHFFNINPHTLVFVRYLASFKELMDEPGRGKYFIQVFIIKGL